ncbi:MAG TPA: HAMP domain-containing sensor histidine kinase [Thermoleophilaceae bacterium]|nr:HAMP domain-containing sensor histidine kinase [Thermoleophilaceae bacterium]
MTRSLAIALAGGAVAAAIVAPVYGGEDALVTAALVIGLSAAGLAAAHALARARPHTRLRSRFALVAAIAAGVIVAAVLAAAELMFVSNHDALMVIAFVVAATLVALRAAQVASSGVVREVESIRDALRAVGAGGRERRVEAAAAAELAELAAAANAMIAQLGEEERRRDAAESARRDLVAAASHDLRTPMAALRLMVDAIEDGLVDEATLRRYLTTMRTHVAALGSMIDDLFELSRLEAGDLEWSIRQVELAGLVNEAVAAMRVEAEARGVAVAAVLPPDPQLARADPEKLQRVLFNLIQNAIRHTPADGSVTVRTEPAGDWVEIEVSDSGDGIPPEDRERVFDPFVRGEAARPQGGAGLGLAISRAIVEGHGGRIWLADSEAGTRVRFVIPA